MTTCLHDTQFFSRLRVSFSEIPGFLDVYSSKYRLPSFGFRSEQGFFYVFRELQDSLVRHLDTMPASPGESEVIVWTLQKDLPFGSFFKDYNGQEKRVPWWIVKPLLKWQQSGESSSIIPHTGATLFIESHPAESERRPVGTHLSLACGSLHSEWHLRPFAVEMRTHFAAGSVFLSVV